MGHLKLAAKRMLTSEGSSKWRFSVGGSGRYSRRQIYRDLIEREPSKESETCNLPAKTLTEKLKSSGRSENNFDFAKKCDLLPLLFKEEPLTPSLQSSPGIDMDTCADSKEINDEDVILTPNYLRGIPFEVSKVFGSGKDRLGPTTAGFRQLVKQYCQLPAYLGTVMFHRIQEYRQMTASLVKEGIIPPYTLDHIPGYEDTTAPYNANTIGLRDFLRFWTSDVRDSNRRYKLLKLLSPPTREGVLVLETENCDFSPSLSITPENIRFAPKRILPKHLKPLLESLVERHPDLQKIKNDELLRKRYVQTILISLFSGHLGSNMHGVTVKSFLQSEVPLLFFKCATCSLQYVPPFGVGVFDRVCQEFERASLQCYGNTKNGSIPVTISSLNLSEEFNWNALISDRIATAFFSNGGQELKFADLVHLLVALEDQMGGSSLHQWFQVLDADKDGYLDRQDLEEVYRAQREVPNQRIADLGFEAFVDVVIDMVGVKLDVQGDFRISPMDIRRSGSGNLLFNLVFARRSEGSAHYPLSVIRAPHKPKYAI